MAVTNGALEALGERFEWHDPRSYGAVSSRPAGCPAWPPLRWRLRPQLGLPQPSPFSWRGGAGGGVLKPGSSLTGTVMVAPLSSTTSTASLGTFTPMTRPGPSGVSTISP